PAARPNAEPRAGRSATRLDRRLALEATRQEPESAAPDDDPKSPLYQPREAPHPARRAAGPASIQNYGPNVRLSTTFGPPGVGESEVSLAAIGSRLVAGWNDGEVFGAQPGFVGFGYSTTTGATWQDGGSLPVAGATDIYYGDP